DAADKVSGRSQYAGDVYLPGMLLCKILQSTRPHARILRMDTSKAQAVPGVRAVITAQDVPDVRFGSGAVKDRRVFALEKVRYVGEPLAAVAAVDEMTALEALDLIRVDYEDLPAVTDPVDALKAGAPLVHADLPTYEGYAAGMGGNVCTVLNSSRGDVERAFAEADVVFEDAFRSQGINQGYLEPMACVATIEPSGRINVWTSTQGPYQVRGALAAVVQMPVSRFRIIPMELGGGFGAKLRLCLEPYPVFLSLKTGKPVKIIATREEVFSLSGFRLPTIIYLKTGVMRDGTIVAREAISIFNMGAYLGAGVQSGVSHTIGPYNIPHHRVRSYAVYTNTIWAGSYRASGVADVTFAVESHTDIIARKLGIDPWEFRMKNALKEGDVAIQGGKIPRNGLHQTLEAIKERMPWPSKSEAGNGVGLALCQWRSGSGPSSASIIMNEDGTASLLTGSVDITGTDTVLAQIAAETLGLHMDQVVIAKRDTDLAPFTAPSGGSRIVYSQGKAVQMAAEDAKQKLIALAAERLEAPPEALTCAGGRVYAKEAPERGYSLSQLARLSLTSKAGPIMGTASLSSMPFAPVFNTQAVEVKVDRETGAIKIVRFVQAQDVGVALNPMAVEGQIEGGAVQGIGRALSEEVVIRDGRIANPSLTTYLMPLAPDMPSIENVLVEVPTEDGPFGARAVAEPPGFGPPAAIANAIADAVGVRIKELPLSADKLLRALRGEPLEEVTLDLALLRELRGAGGPIQWAGSG
ncbi:MAG: xanthine dehydrogenase family protein molybdopterin-binding subunit, partial [Nitrospinae bacterium]|nr:xanthine dehydrogenase family protein molybdopterin-binding subunit [Nitrospinota bacterium]